MIGLHSVTYFYSVYYIFVLSVYKLLFKAFLNSFKV